MHTGLPEEGRARTSLPAPSDPGSGNQSSNYKMTPGLQRHNGGFDQIRTDEGLAVIWNMLR